MSEKNETPIIDRAVNAGGNQLLNVVTAGRSLELAANALRDALEIAKVTDLTGNPNLRKPIDAALAQFDALRKGNP